jgi:hypothetical protein
MNLKCYKSVILSPTELLLINERLINKQRAAIFTARCVICVGPGRYDKASLVSSQACRSSSLRRF